GYVGEPRHTPGSRDEGNVADDPIAPTSARNPARIGTQSIIHERNPWVFGGSRATAGRNRQGSAYGRPTPPRFAAREARDQQRKKLGKRSSAPRPVSLGEPGRRCDGGG